jgi:LPS-assembly protein
VSDSDFQSTKGIQFDYEDRLINRNTVSFFLGNRLVRKSWSTGAPVYKQIASFKIGQSYDLDEAKESAGPSRFPWSDVSALLDVRLEHFETNTVVRYFPYHNKTNTSARVKAMDDSGRFLQMNLAQTFLITQNIDEAYQSRTENIGFSAGFDSRYVTFSGGIDYLPVDWKTMNLQVKSWTTQLNIKPPGNCWGIRASFRQDIANELLWKIDFDYKFGGEQG